MRSKELIRLLAPPLLLNGYHSLRNGRAKSNLKGQESFGLFGNYRSWDEAMAASTGYDSEVILEKTKTSLLKVKNGEAVYERDSVIFDEIQYAWPLLAGLMWVAAQLGGRLNVLDFGGSLGSTYFQNCGFLRRIPEIRWNIVEQSGHVEIGKTWFEDDHLKFYSQIDDCLAETKPNVVLLSSVMQYLEHPYDVLRKLLQLTCDHLIVDRTPFWDGLTDMLCVQHVPPEIYPASYPSWIFSTQRFRSLLNEAWEIVTEFDNPDRLVGPVTFAYRGMIAIKRDFR
jgi:putative methyltransferase (TIGR04325 family)